MHESSAAVIVGDNVELWSISRTRHGFSCLRTVYANTAAMAYGAIAASGRAVRANDGGLSGAMLDSLPLSRPTSSSGCSVTRPAAAVSFFAGEGRSLEIREQAQSLVRAVAPLLDVVD